MTATLTDFLLARIEEDEALARAAQMNDGRWTSMGNVNMQTHDASWEGVWEAKSVPVIETWSSDNFDLRLIAPVAPDDMVFSSRNTLERGLRAARVSMFVASHDPARVLAECDARRRLVELHSWARGGTDPCDAHDGATSENEDCDVLKLLALPLANRPDYDESWRP